MLRKSLNFKQNYTDTYFLGKNENGISFIANELEFFYYQLPLMLIVHLILGCVFRITFNFKLSVAFRKYCFLGLIFFMLFEGNLEEFVFYYFLECLTLFSANATHRLVNVFILSFGFMMFFYTFGCFFFFYYYYGKKGKCLFQDYRFTFYSFLAAAVESGIITFFSGAIQSLLFNDLLIETILLVSMEIQWIAIRIWLLHQSVYLFRRRVVINIIDNVLRIIFLLTLYWYQLGGDEYLQNNAHFCILFAYLGTWALETVCTLFIAFQ
jgi:hypothetical protein